MGPGVELEQLFRQRYLSKHTTTQHTHEQTEPDRVRPAEQHHQSCRLFVRVVCFHAYSRDEEGIGELVYFTSSGTFKVHITPESTAFLTAEIQ